MIQKIWSYLVGYVLIKVEGRNIEKFINMCMKRGILLWDLRWVDNNQVSAKVRLGGFRAIRHICRTVSCRVKVGGRNGLPFFVSLMKKRKMMVAGAAIFSILLYVLSNFVWKVDVEGNKTVTDAQILLFAKRAGLDYGTPKWNMEVKSVEQQVLNNVPYLEWVGIKVKGTRAIIEVVEKKLAKKIDDRPANIIANKAGIIKEIIVLQGEAKVMEDDLIRPGMVLISGELVTEKPGEPPEEAKPSVAPVKPLTPEEKEKELTIKEYKYVHAEGMVKARVWYNEYGENEIVTAGTRDTGKMIKVISLNILGKRIVIKGPKGSPYNKYRQVVQVKRVPKWRNLSIPVELISTEYYETENYRTNYGIEGAKAKAVEKAMARIKKQLPERYALNKKQITQINTPDDNLIRIRILFETIEDIGKVQYIKSFKTTQ
jgi:similar to stage IV sporulation protein